MTEKAADELALGRVGAPYGLDGRLKFVPFSGEVDHLRALSDVTLRNGDDARRARVASVEPYAGGALVKFAGYDSPEAARALSGSELWAPRASASPLGPDEYYYGDLVGCSLVAGDATVAAVTGVCEGGGGELLEVRRPGHETEYVPFRREFVGRVDVKARRIELLAPWILE